MENITLTIGEYRDLISIKKKDLQRKIQQEANKLNQKSFTDILYSTCKLSEWKFEYEAICEELERTAPTKYCSDDISF